MDERPPSEPPDPEDVERELRAAAVATDRTEASEVREDREPGSGKAPGPVRRATPPLRRRATGKIVAGVAGGLADRWAVPAWLVRIPFGLALFLDAVMVWNSLGPTGWLGGLFGISTRLATYALVMTFAYGLLWWFVPRADVGVSAVRQGVRRFGVAPVRRASARYPGLRSWPGLVLLAIGGALLADQLGIWNPNVALAFGLIALGVILFRREPSTGAAPVREPVRVGSGASGVPDVVDIPERAPRERSPLAWIVFGTSLLVMCVAAIAVQGGAVERIATVPALGLLVLGVGLLVASVFGRGRWLILPALLLVPPMLFASVIRLPIEGRYGDTAVYVRDISELPAAYHTVVGRVFVDLSKFDRRDDIRDLPLTLTAVAGSVTVIVPYDATYTATGYTGIGALSFGSDANETQIAASATVHADSKYEGGPSFVFDLETGVGNATILREAPTRQQLHELEKASNKEHHR